MSSSRTIIRATAAAVFAATMLLSGCSTLETKEDTIAQTNVARLGPEQAPFRSITGFSGSLRCMDNLMIDYGVRDVSMLVEELDDNTKKVNAGTRDMLITAVSDMTRRSRAVRVVAFGKDSTNAISFLAAAQRQSAYDVVPQYDIKGSVSQFDENVIRNQKDAGFGFSPFLNLGAARDNATSVLGLDVSVLTTNNMSVLSGVTSRNSVVILRSGKGLDADAAFNKFGVNYSMTLSKSEGQTQALRGLVELAVVELMGKLTKTPYWTCLNASADSNEEVKQEVSDWFYAMAASRLEIIAYFQNQMRIRGFYDGPIDGQFNPAIDEAISNYRAALGMSREPKLDEAFFRAYLAADHSKIPAPARPASVSTEPVAAAPATPPPKPAAAGASPITLVLAADRNRTRFEPGQPFNLTVRASRDAHVYCYLQDETAKIIRFFPNRFDRDSLVSASKPLQLPGSGRFQFVMNDRGVPETIACFATQRDVSTALPATMFGTDFEPLVVGSIEQIRSAFVSAAGNAVTEQRLELRSK